MKILLMSIRNYAMIKENDINLVIHIVMYCENQRPLVIFLVLANRNYYARHILVEFLL